MGTPSTATLTYEKSYPMRSAVPVLLFLWVLSISSVTSAANSGSEEGAAARSVKPLLVAQTACLKMFAAPLGKYGIVNNCGECKKAVLAWCDGSIRRVNVPAYGQTTGDVCIGVINLVGENPC